MMGKAGCGLCSPTQWFQTWDEYIDHRQQDHPGREPSQAQSLAIMAGTIAYSVATFLVSLSMNPAPLPYPDIALASTDGGQSYYVTAVEPGLQWGHFVPFGCNRRPFGTVEVGDVVSSCNGFLALDYNALEGQA